MTRVKTLVLGPSHWHVPLLAERIAARHDVVGISDATPTAVAGLAELWDAPVSESWREVVAAHPDAELAYVFLPHDEMREACLALIARTIPFVVEKPAGISLAELVEIRTAAEAAGVPTAVPLVQRGGPVDRWLERAGQAVYESTRFIAGPPERYLANGSPWMVEPARAGGGCLLNLAPHFIDLFLQSAGASSAAVTASLSSALHGRPIEDFASLTLTTPDGRIATIETGYAFPDSPLKRHCSYLRTGTAGTASIGSDGTASFTSTEGVTETARFDVDSDPLYAVFVDAVADGLEDGWTGLPGIRDLEATMEIVWAAYAHARRGEER
ncbi:Gfo/Idh/MocA family protein [Rathayibacter sp. VKM Ac-2857]|uniref:Gfo/Idh/MocA family protein n=1 Tax=Rathayibacter sp. VKM Ac-2857 TaxID=2739020 RepID=UPI001563F306|nr:Gfo/Idh/MocA family oxidoreductase [Rathayibacter sp. VKM Ac-2857]NQX18302.1 Gfo/Idh/MocA family oxidoreductase [Rathayibacter sp. VKM Ac-2857]